MTASDSGLVFDIQRFALQDGEGIRTTVFLKGCPLRCRWCQNPEGLNRKQRPVWIASRCIGCRRCEQAAESGQMAWTGERPQFSEVYDGGFQNLIDACPSGAIRYDSRWYTPAQLLERILEDKVFYRQGGGVTFSGGEPLLQAGFLKQVLPLCRKNQIPAAIETALDVPLETVQEILPQLDQIYADMKIFDPALHRACTGADPGRIRENIRWLLKSPLKSRVTIRTPLIPGMTASTENIAAIAGYLVSLDPDVQYELLNYNPLAPAKYPLAGLEYGVPGQHPKYTLREMEVFRKAAENAGVRRLR